ncbi:aminopeptidase Q [Rhinophrynus dorsalis]
MGPKSSSGFYLSRTSALLLSLLLAALLLALIVLGALYAQTRGADQEEVLSRFNTPTVTIPTTSSLGLRTPPTTSRPGIWDNLRLPPNLVPLHYELELWPKMYPNEENKYLLSGQVNITIHCVEGTDIVLLHSHKLNFTRAQLTQLKEAEKKSQLGVRAHDLTSRSSEHIGNAASNIQGVQSDAGSHLLGNSIVIKNLWISEFHQYLVLELDESLEAGNLYVLELDYTGFLSDDFTGLFITHYKDLNIDKVLVASEMEPTSARNVFPCFDEPALKARFKIRMVHNSSFVALSNMPAVAMTEREDVNGSKWTVTTFNTTLKMSTYITAFVVCDFDYVSTTERGHEIRIWARKELVQKGYTSFALSIAGPILSYMEDLLNITYPLQKTDFVSLPEFGVGAMENWGLITFQEPSLTYDPDQKFSNAKALTCLIVSHEIGHQWFGNLVTMKWWNDIWLNEGFASYMEFLGASFIEPKLKLNELFVMHNLQHIFERDALASSRAVSVKEEEIQEAEHIIKFFDMFTYSKGAAFVRMLSSFLTEKLFIKAISSYLKTYSFSNADQDDLWNHIQMIIDEQDVVQLPTSLRHIMDSWMWQEGIPLLTLNTSTGEMTNERFQAVNSPNITSDHNETWIIPVSWMKNGLQQPTVWLDNRTKFFPEMKTESADDWIILNINITGYYRTNYDEKNWDLLAQLLEKDPKVLPVVNRVQLIEDAFMLAKSGYIEYEAALNLTKYLEKEEELIVWYTVLKNIMSSKNPPLFTYDSFSLIKKYILKRIDPIYQRFASLIRTDFNETADDYFVHLEIEIILRTVCTLGLQDCLNLATELYATWMLNSTYNGIPHSIRNVIYCYAIAEGSEKEWEFAWNMFNKSEDKIEADFLIHGMSCTKEPWLLRRYLQNALGIDPSSALDIFLCVIRNDIGRHIAWEFLKENWQRINDMVPEPSHFYDILLLSFGEKATSELQFQDIQMFIINTMNETARNNSLQKLESKKKIGLEWTNKPNSKIIDWLQENTKESEF